MSERFQKLYSLAESQYILECPVIVEAGNLLLDTNTGKIVAQLKLKNISNKVVTAVTVFFSLFDANGSSISECQKHQYLNINVQRGHEFGQKNAIFLNNAAARSYKVNITEVIMSDGEIWQSSNNSYISLPKQQNLSIFFDNADLVKQYQIETTEKAEFLPKRVSDLWLCTCGAVNHANEMQCYQCGVMYDNQVNCLDSHLLKEHIDIRQQELLAERKTKRKFTRKLIACTGVICLLIVMLATIYAKLIAPVIKEKALEDTYYKAMQLLDAEDFDAAISAFDSLGDYMDSEEVKERTICYQTMLDALGQENFVVVKEMYSSLHGFQKADFYIEKSNQKYFAAIESAIENGDLETAESAFLRCVETSDNSAYIQAEKSIQKIKDDIVSSLQGTWICQDGSTYYECYEVEGSQYKRTGIIDGGQPSLHFETHEDGTLEFRNGKPHFLSTEIKNITKDSFDIPFINSPKVKTFYKK